MCGIAGVLGRWPGLDLRLFRDRATELLAHRGPNGFGSVVWRDGAFVPATHGAIEGGAEGILVHRRLAILDLTDAGSQPMLSRDGERALVFNGEIYNYRELRSELGLVESDLGSAGDTAVLLEWIGRFGTSRLSAMCGMFAFAHIDLRRRKFFLVRDGLGIKPLYVVRHAGALAFASEPRLLLELPGISRRASPVQSIGALRFGLPRPSRQSAFADLEEIEAGCAIEGELSSVANASYRRWYDLPGERTFTGSRADAADALRQLFLRSVELHMRSDRRVGSALSGGIDSSSVVSAMKTLRGTDVEVECVSFIASTPELSEQRWAELVASTARVRIHRVFSKDTDVLEDLDDYLTYQGEPVGGTSGYAQYCVYRTAAKNGLTVMLDGQGPDEMLAGYTFFLDTRLRELLSKGNIGSAMRLAHSPHSIAAGLGGWERVARAAVVATRESARRLWRPGGHAELKYPWIDTSEARSSELLSSHVPENRNSLASHLAFATRNGLTNLFRLADRNAMRFSIENRVPFATTQMADLIFSFPLDYMFGENGESKAILRDAMRELVPSAILQRRDKIGFANDDVVNLLRARAWVEDTLPVAAECPFVCQRELTAAWKQFQSGREPLAAGLWSALVYLRWWKLFGLSA